MSGAWETKSLVDVAELQGRIGWKGLTAKEYKPDGPYFLSVHSLNYGDFVDFRDAFHISQERYDESPEIMLRRDDVLICKDGAGIGKVGIVGDMPSPSTINSSLLLIRARPNILPKYLYLILQSPYFQDIVQSRLEGATTPHLYQRDIATFPVRLPPLEEQRRIVTMLDEAFAAIATATANAEKNLANARELFPSFLRQAGASATNRKSVRLGECATVISGQHIDARDYNTVGDGIGYLTGPSDFGETYPTVSKWTLVPKRTALPGDILITVKGSGVGGINLMGNEELAISRQLMAVRATRYPVELLYFALEAGFDHFQRLANGAAIPGISRIDVLGFEFSVPDDDEIDQFLERLKRVRRAGTKLAENAKAKMAKLAALKQSLLHRAFSGELTEREPIAA